MSARSADCPSCGAAITFANAASVMVVCAHCGTASVRRDADLEKMGKVADVAPIESALSLGASGKWKNRRFSVIGQVQLDHGKGPWNEWCALFDDGEVGWIAEAQGEVLVTFPRDDVAPPPYWQLRVGADVVLGGETFVVAEAGRARVTTARGELPQDLRPGSEYRYFDLRGASDRFATVSIDDEDAADAYVGWAVATDSITVDASTTTVAPPRRAASDRFACPNCASPIHLLDAANSQRVVCPSCGSMMDPRDRKLRVIEKAKRLETRPVIPIGAKARLRGQDFEVLAFLVRSVRSGGVRYPWQEYLLRRADGAYRWLVCSDGHWTFAEPVALGAVRRTREAAAWNGETFRHFQGGEAVVDHVQGEVYWEVSIGEKVDVADYVAPPRMLSFESAPGEIVASVGQYVTRDEMAAAFPGVARWPWPAGVAPNQPNPWMDASRRLFKAAGALLAVAIALMIVFRVTAANSVVARVEATSPAGATPTPSAAPSPAPTAEDAGVVFSDEFRLIPTRANVEVELHAPVLSNTWLGVDGALVNLDTGDVHAFALMAEFWSGVEDGERWSEGGHDATAYLGGVPAGRYALRLDSETGGGAAVPYTVVARSQVPSTGRGFLLLLFLLVPPVVATLVGVHFETRRWATSDHAPGDDE